MARDERPARSLTSSKLPPVCRRHCPKHAATQRNTVTRVQDVYAEVALSPPPSTGCVYVCMCAFASASAEVWGVRFRFRASSTEEAG